MSSTPFRPGERIVMPFLPVLKVENFVAILKKTRFAVTDGCGARHRIRVETPFLVRGGFRVFEATKFKVPSSALEVRYKTPYGVVYTVNLPRRQVYIDQPSDDALATLVKKLLEREGVNVVEIIDVKQVEEIVPVTVYARRFKHAEVIIPPDDYFIHINKDYEGDTYFVYEFMSPDEVKLVDDVSRVDYVLHIFSHGLSSRAACAAIKILSGDVVWQETKQTCCRTASNAAAVVVSRFGSKTVVAYNNAPYRGCCEDWKIEEWASELPPRLVSQYRTTDPIPTNIPPEDVV